MRHFLTDSSYRTPFCQKFSHGPLERGELRDSWTDMTLPPGRHTLMELIAKRLLAKKLSEAPGREMTRAES